MRCVRCDSARCWAWIPGGGIRSAPVNHPQHPMIMPKSAGQDVAEVRCVLKRTNAKPAHIFVGAPVKDGCGHEWTKKHTTMTRGQSRRCNGSTLFKKQKRAWPTAKAQTQRHWFSKGLWPEANNGRPEIGCPCNIDSLHECTLHAISVPCVFESDVRLATTSVAARPVAGRPGHQKST